MLLGFVLSSYNRNTLIKQIQRLSVYQLLFLKDYFLADFFNSY